MTGWTAAAAVAAIAVSAAAAAPSLRACSVEDLEQARDLDPAHMPALFQRAMLFWRDGDIARARREFARIIRLKRRQAELAVEEL